MTRSVPELDPAALLAAYHDQLRTEDHEPLPGATVTPATGMPLLSTPDTKRTPPVARTANSLAADDAKKAKAEVSAQTKLPSCSAFAR